jgi:hypothetical protein
MEIRTTIDMTIPFWGLICACVVGAFYLIKMKFEIDEMKNELRDIKQMVYQMWLPEHNKKNGKY